MKFSRKVHILNFTIKKVSDRFLHFEPSYVTFYGGETASNWTKTSVHLRKSTPKLTKQSQQPNQSLIFRFGRSWRSVLKSLRAAHSFTTSPGSPTRNCDFIWKPNCETTFCAKTSDVLIGIPFIWRFKIIRSFLFLFYQQGMVMYFTGKLQRTVCRSPRAFKNRFQLFFGSEVTNPLRT